MHFLNDPRINETVRAAARYVIENPGCTAQQIADAIHLSHDHIRKSVVPVLKRLGFRNYRNGSGYLPPENPTSAPHRKAFGIHKLSAS